MVNRLNKSVDLLSIELNESLEVASLERGFFSVYAQYNFFCAMAQKISLSFVKIFLSTFVAAEYIQRHLDQR